jgi:hypothetical protein
MRVTGNAKLGVNLAEQATFPAPEPNDLFNCRIEKRIAVVVISAR